jgi:antitoxin (DNA-binding transcriptional repressor) of toxin-antitoxin stability system
MQTRSISVTEAARNFSDCVNRARYQGVTFVLHRNGVPVARLVPELVPEAQKQSAPAPLALAAGADVPDAPSATAPMPARSLW